MQYYVFRFPECLACGIPPESGPLSTKLTSNFPKIHPSNHLYVSTGYSYTYNINILVPRICLDCQNGLCSKVAEFNLFNLTPESRYRLRRKGFDLKLRKNVSFIHHDSKHWSLINMKNTHFRLLTVF